LALPIQTHPADFLGNDRIASMIKILLVDDQIMVRRGLRMRLALEPDLEIIGEAGNGHEALDLTRVLNPDVIVMDIEMPDLDGIAALRILSETVPGCPVIILSLHDDAQNRARALSSGAKAFVSKQGGASQLVDTIRKIRPDLYNIYPDSA
jgi:DNA-binding NarL/FixJ family response regulator